jgi:hypothetical protein
MTDNEYIVSELSKALRDGSETIKLKAMGLHGESRWVSINREDFGKVLGLFQEENK